VLEPNDSLDFLHDNPTMAFRAVKRKSELRYIASKQRGSLKAVTRFAPPTKRFPQMILDLLGLVNFSIPGFGKTVPISQRFLEQCAEALKIPADHVGIYVGEPNKQQKLVIIDVTGKSTFVLKMAIGAEADSAIGREVRGGALAADAEGWKGRVPDIEKCESICGRAVIRIEHIPGRQMTPEEFEETFFSDESSFKDEILSFKSRGVSIGEWLNQNLKYNTLNLKPLIDSCRECGALELRSEIGVIHGDFAPWNVILRRNLESSKKEKAIGVIDWEYASAHTPSVFDYAYAAWCYFELLGRTSSRVEPHLWMQLVSLGALWKALREELSGSS
jgi:hypothetical protein